MTYLETEAMNRPFREAEAVLLVEPENRRSDVGVGESGVDAT